ncbi:MAG: Fic family protein [Bacteroidia bacterium]
MSIPLKIISSQYLEKYAESCQLNWSEVEGMLHAKDVFSVDDFEYYIVASSLFSSKIEGNTLDFNSFYRNRNKKGVPKRKEVSEIENLVTTYRFASLKKLNKINFLDAHKILSATLLPLKERGKFRTVQVGVRDSATGRPVYLAVEPEFVNVEMSKLFSDITVLMKSKLSITEVFYYASMIHLWTAKIHPFGDGNGRSARLLEKWFLVAKLGGAAWSINSEKFYWDNRLDYYQNVALGFNYYALKWERCMPFLLMLTKASQS